MAQKARTSAIWISPDYIRILSDELDNPDEILVGIIIAANQYTNQTGLYAISIKEISIMTNLEQKRIIEILTVLESKNLCVYDNRLIFVPAIPTAHGFPGELRWSLKYILERKSEYADTKGRNGENRAYLEFLAKYEPIIAQNEAENSPKVEETPEISENSGDGYPTVAIPLDNPCITIDEPLLNHSLTDYQPFSKSQSYNHSKDKSFSLLGYENEENTELGGAGEKREKDFLQKISESLDETQSVPAALLLDFTRICWAHYDAKGWRMTQQGDEAKTDQEREKWLKAAWINEHKRTGIAGNKFSDEAISDFLTNKTKFNAKPTNNKISGNLALAAIAELEKRTNGV